MIILLVALCYGKRNKLQLGESPNYVKVSEKEILHYPILKAKNYFFYLDLLLALNHHLLIIHPKKVMRKIKIHEKLRREEKFLIKNWVKLMLFLPKSREHSIHQL